MTDIEEIKAATVAAFKLPPDAMISKTRVSHIAIPRQIAMALSREMREDISLEEIGNSFGGRHHSTVTHACSQLSAWIEGDKFYGPNVAKLRQDLTTQQITK